MNERSTLELEEEMARLRDQLKLVGEQGRATRELHTRELTPETKVAHEGRLEEMNHLLEAYHRIAQELSQRTGAYSSGPLSCRQGRCTALSPGAFGRSVGSQQGRQNAGAPIGTPALYLMGQNLTPSGEVLPPETLPRRAKNLSPITLPLLD
jgi:hypothetical protein